MTLHLHPAQKRRCAWTDRKNGYLEFRSDSAGHNAGGYFRGDKTLLCDIFLSAQTDLWRSNAVRTEVSPEGALVIYSDSGDIPSLGMSLLEGEGALALILGDRPADSGFGGGLLFPAPESERLRRFSPFLDESGITLHEDGMGIAIASTSPFSLYADGDGRVTLESPGTGEVVWYIAFEESAPAARGKALRLAADNGLSSHRERVAAALSRSSVNTGDARFDTAVAWAAFTGWMFATDTDAAVDATANVDTNANVDAAGSRGIWAGLPWFRDNWGRDTFIALSGTLLAGGHFAEARSVLVAFARHQDLDPSSPTWGRIPNRFRGKNDVIYNTADGTLWFVRAAWEYLQYTADRGILADIGASIDLAIRADLERRTDSHGFLLHGDADTWMDARIRGDAPWSPRGDRANDVQALWYTALRIAARLALLAGNDALAESRNAAADRLRSSFRRLFWSAERDALADRLPPGPHGEWERDFSVRSNQLLALSVPSVLGAEEALLEPGMRARILENVDRELVSPFGLYSLCPDDPRFHPRHEDPERYHKDAAYHNGTIWVWNSGPYLSASVLDRPGSLPARAEALIANEARMILEFGCAGSLPENIHAMADALGDPVLSGTWSQAWSVSEFSRNVHEDIVGFRPRLMEGRIDFAPSLPAGTDRISARLPFGSGEICDISVERDAAGVLRATLVRLGVEETTPVSLRADAKGSAGLAGSPVAPGTAPEAGSPLSVNGVPFLRGIPVELSFPGALSGKAVTPRPSEGSGITSRTKLPALYPDRWIVDPFPIRDLETDWCGAVHHRNWLESFILSGRGKGAGGGPYTAELEWFFDSDFFRRKYETRGTFGAIWSPDQTLFRLWAPTARSVELLLWQSGSAAEDAAACERATKDSAIEGNNPSGSDFLARYSARNDSPDDSVPGGFWGQSPTMPKVIPMCKGCGTHADGAGITDAGVWEIAVPGDLHGVYYTFRVRAHGIVRESADPAARAAGVNGKRSMVLDHSRANPQGWSAVRAPTLESPNDAVVYELHVADATSSPSWRGPESLRRRYAGVTAPGVTVAGVNAAYGPVDGAVAGVAARGFPAGFDHFRALGITHVQLLPVFDFGSVDESRHRERDYADRLVGGLFNWGYDPENYSVPEGSYSSDPFDGATRVHELKSMIRDFNEAGIGVVMDVVYNHVPAAQNHALGICVPGYYFRPEKYSAAGDDTASERPMFRSYMIDSLTYWLAEYKLSGFRFDLMGLHDVGTMKAIVDSLRKIKGDVLVYGEGWDMYRAGKTVGASMVEAKKMPGIGFFNDAFRCALKGDAFIQGEGGFVHGGSRRESVKFGLVGAVYHPQVHNGRVTGTANPNPWTDLTASSIAYTEIHDNSTLFDKLSLVEPEADEKRLLRLQKIAIGLVLLSQGMPILHAGVEFARTKEIPADLLAANPHLCDLYRTPDRRRAFTHNSYNLGDRINCLDWERRARLDGLVAFVGKLVAIRRAHAHFRLRTAVEVAAHLTFIGPDGLPEPASPSGQFPDRAFGSPDSRDRSPSSRFLAWTIGDPSGTDAWTRVFAAVNVGEDPLGIVLPPGGTGRSWHLVAASDGLMDGHAHGECAAIQALSRVLLDSKALYLYAEF